jgi:glycosyltransferase involved in cell wall biosynthesis
MRILFANHTGSVSGAELALLRLLGGLRAEHQLVVACPDEGRLPAALDHAGIQRTAIPSFEASFRPHPLHTPAGLASLMAGGGALALAARRLRADVLYANSTRCGLMGAVARGFGAPATVVRVHDHLPRTRSGRIVQSTIAGTAGAVLAVSDYTAARFNEGLRRPVATRVYNSIDHERFDPNRVTPARLREELRIDARALLIGQVAQITPWKGQADAIRTLADLRRSGIDAHLAIVGEIAFEGPLVRYDNPAYLAELHELVRALSIADAVHFLGHREDVPAVFAELDLSLLPSWEEPFGLVVIESLAMGTPAFVASGSGAAELVEDGISGRVLPPRRPERWADAIRELGRDRAILERMASRGPERAAGFRDDVHAREIAGHLERVADGGRRRWPDGAREAGVAR